MTSFKALTEIDILQQTLNSIGGMDKETFDLSLPYWKFKTYKKGDFFNEYKNVCKHLGFITDGVFRVYKSNEDSGEEKNMLFFSKHQFFTSYKSFLSQMPCNYYTQSMGTATIVYIHTDHLNKLYQQSHQWERVGRMLAEAAFNDVMTNTEGFLFKSPEARYTEMLEKHPDLLNSIPLYHIASYLGIAGPSLSRIRKRMVNK